MDVAVIGSGVSGTFAAHALANRGISATILDVGETLDARHQAVVDRLHDLAPERWPTEDFALIDENPTYGKGVLPKKVHFGSDYIYADDRPFARIKTNTAGRVPYPTLAKGGFSTIWGAAVLPPDACDMADWPISRADMEPYFRKVAQQLPICGGEGNLEPNFPLYKEAAGSLDPGPQGERLLADLKRAEGALLKRQTIFGKARLAVHTADADHGVLACNGCGFCFTGCVRGSIFSTLPMLADLVRKRGVTHRTGVFVDLIAERAGKAVVEVVDTRSLERSTLTFDAAFIAGGPINSTRLLLRSRQLYDRPVLLKESQKFVLPMLRLHGAPSGIEHPSISLASVFLATKTPSLSDHWLHAQIVPMNAMIVQTAGLPGTDNPITGLLWKPVLRRMMAAWCGMHSDHSSQVMLRLRRDSGGADVLDLELQVLQRARADARTAAKDLFSKGLLFDTVFYHWMMKFSNPGSGTHCGASFPMKEFPKDVLDSDVLGRPFGWTRIFVVDSSILPSIPGTTLAFSVMANAYRISSIAPL
jgi:choline dehydrogenase-like flavoprotein